MGKVRIIGGTYRSRVVTFDDKLSALRPTPDRVRETLFNWLNQDLTGLACLDLFAGSGALGLEAISRNAKMVTCIERDTIAIKQLKANQQILDITNLEIIKAEAIHYLSTCNQKYDVIFLDPPYASDLLNQSLALIEKHEILSKYGKIYIEYSKIMPDLANYQIIKQGKAGSVNYALIGQD